MANVVVDTSLGKKLVKAEMDSCLRLAPSSNAKSLSQKNIGRPYRACCQNCKSFRCDRIQTNTVQGRRRKVKCTTSTTDSLQCDVCRQRGVECTKQVFKRVSRHIPSARELRERAVELNRMENKLKG